MLYRNLTKWDDAAKTPSLLYFAQLLEEMLFEFSLDTYKPSVMHTGLLCSEARSTIEAVEAGTIKAPNIFHVTAEIFEHVAPAFDNMQLKITNAPPPNLDLTRFPTLHGADLPGLYATIEKVQAGPQQRARQSRTLIDAYQHVAHTFPSQGEPLLGSRVRRLR